MFLYILEGGGIFNFIKRLQNALEQEKRFTTLFECRRRVMLFFTIEISKSAMISILRN